MLGWRVVVVSVTCSAVLVTLYKLYCCPPLKDGRTYLPLNESTQLRLAPVPMDNQLIDLEKFNFLTDHECNGTSPFVLALVHSAPKNTFNREAIRGTWGKTIKVLFLLGETDFPLDEEEMLHGDLIRGSFADSYRNLTYKHVMGLKWISSKCPRVKYVLKTDDDVFVHADAFKKWLLNLSPHGAKNLLACKVEINAVVRRSYRSKWRVTPEEYPGRYYPNYCLGWVVVYSPDVVINLYLESRKTSYFWVDDVLITGILAERANVTHTQLGSLAESNSDVVSNIISGEHDKPFIFLLSTPDKFHQIGDSIDIYGKKEKRYTLADN